MAEVVEVLKDWPGLRVRFRDLVPSGDAAQSFVRVLCPRMSEKGGAAAWMPEVGEMGLVTEIFGGYFVWLGSMAMLDKNQFDLTAGLAFLRHQSGLTIQIREKGDFEILHPSGFRITIGKEAGALPALEKTSTPTTGDTTAPVLEVIHPSGATFSVDGDGNGVVKGFASLVFQEGSKRFAMEGLFDYVKSMATWIRAHTHISSGAGVPNSPPSDPVLADTCSPDTFLGPQGG